jgi:hypothetical protein
VDPELRSCNSFFEVREEVLVGVVGEVNPFHDRNTDRQLLEAQKGCNQQKILRDSLILADEDD